ncbi:MAG TPA: ABC transporter substrate-binding protein [Stellaceae bacterium]|nr:ABC transporter substrate-binding protein [Stellaceae bacterium]
MIRHKHRAGWAARLGVLCCLVLCGLGAAPGIGRAAEVVAAARDALPEAVKSAGVLRLATALQWPPFAYKNDKGEAEGIDVELAGLVAAKLGLKLELTDLKFPSIIPGVTTGRFDIGMDQLARTAEREQVVQFVVYFRSAMGLLVRKGVSGIDVHNLCGHTLALTQGSSQVAVAQRLSDGCVKDGKPAIAFQFYPASADSYLAVSNGRGDGFLTGSAVGGYIAAHDDKLQMTKATLPETSELAGIVIAKGNDQLAKAVQLALESAIEDGTYMDVLKKHGAEDGALTVADVRARPGH